MPEIVVPKEYGYVSYHECFDDEYWLHPLQQQVLATFGVSALYLFRLGIQTGVARKAAGVPYPYGTYILSIKVIVYWLFEYNSLCWKGGSWKRPQETHLQLCSTRASGTKYHHNIWN